MTSDLSIFAARLREFISICAGEPVFGANTVEPALQAHQDAEFNGMAMVLFALQFHQNPAYRKFCEARKVVPHTVTHWTHIPAVPTAVFKELDLSCLPAPERTTVFHSSGTTAQRPSRHFHNAGSLTIYEASLWPWFARHVVGDLRFAISDLRATPHKSSDLTPDTSHLTPDTCLSAILLAPPPAGAPHSSLVHMFETVRRRLGAPVSSFVGTAAGDGSWTLDFGAALAALGNATANRRPVLLLGTAFSYVHLLDYIASHHLHYRLPPGSCVMETGGYKGRSRSLGKTELHALVSQQLGIPPTHIVCEYGMSELGSQAYDLTIKNSKLKITNGVRMFHFPPWARAQVVSPETGAEVAEGEAGLLRVFDLANVYSVMAIQTEDLTVRRGDGFELIGRNVSAEPRGCSLMAGDA